MTRALLSILSLAFCALSNAQSFSGQWKGHYIDNTQKAGSEGSRSDYLIDLTVNGTAVAGYSYTTFVEGAHKYYSVCKLTGYADKKSGRIGITEVARTKTNMPKDFISSFQIHKLTWRVNAGEEILEGRWNTTNGQIAGGHGTTVLKRRQLNALPCSSRTATASKDPFKRTQTAGYIAAAKTNGNVTRHVQIGLARPNNGRPMLAALNLPQSNDPGAVATPPATISNEADNVPVADRPLIPSRYAGRQETLQHTIRTIKPVVYVELYDNGEIDGDSVSLYYNGNQLLCHRMLTQNAISIELEIAAGIENELVMHADNLGSIPPNTALLIVQDGPKRYELRLASDLKKSGVVKFIRQ